MYCYPPTSKIAKIITHMESEEKESIIDQKIQKLLDRTELNNFFDPRFINALEWMKKKATKKDYKFLPSKLDETIKILKNKSAFGRCHRIQFILSSAPTVKEPFTFSKNILNISILMQINHDNVISNIFGDMLEDGTPCLVPYKFVRYQIEKFKKPDQWQFFTNKNNSWIVVLPKNCGISSPKDLNRHGFNENELSEIQFNQIPALCSPLFFSEPDTEKDTNLLVEDLPNIFANSSIKKRTHFVGHGLPNTKTETGDIKNGSMVHLPITSLNKLFSHFQTLGFDFIQLLTCYGASNMMVNALYGKKYPFYISILSMGDFPTFLKARHFEESSYFKYKAISSNSLEFWNQLNQTMDQTPQKRKTFISALNQICSNFTNIPVMIKPNSNKARALQIETMGTTITPKKCLQLKNDAELPSIICDKPYVALYPELIPLHIILKAIDGTLPVIYSRIPDEHFHFIAKISSSEKTYEQILEESLEYSHNSLCVRNEFDIGKKHVFFVLSIEDKDGVKIENLMAVYYPGGKGKKAIYQHDGKWLHKQNILAEISLEKATLEIFHEALTTKPAAESLEFIGIDSMGSYLDYVKTAMKDKVSVPLLNFICDPSDTNSALLNASEFQEALDFAMTHKPNSVTCLIKNNPHFKVNHKFWSFVIENKNLELINYCESLGFSLTDDSNIELLFNKAVYTKSTLMIKYIFHKMTTFDYPVINAIILELDAVDYVDVIEQIISSDKYTNQKIDKKLKINILSQKKLIKDKNFELLNKLINGSKIKFNFRLKFYHDLFESMEDAEKVMQIYFNSLDFSIENVELSTQRMNKFIVDCFMCLRTCKLFHKDWLKGSLTVLINDSIQKIADYVKENHQTYHKKLSDKIIEDIYIFNFKNKKCEQSLLNFLHLIVNGPIKSIDKERLTKTLSG